MIPPYGPHTPSTDPPRAGARRCWDVIFVSGILAFETKGPQKNGRGSRARTAFVAERCDDLTAQVDI